MTRALALAVLLAAAPALAADAKADAPQTEDQKTFYALGVWLGERVTVFNLNPSELKWVSAGLRDAATGQKSQVDLKVYSPKINELAQSRMAVVAEKRKGQEQAYLEKAAKEPGVEKTTLPR